MRHGNWLWPVLGVPVLAFAVSANAWAAPVDDRATEYMRADSGSPSWASGFFDDWNLSVVGRWSAPPTGFFTGGGRVEGQLFVRPGAGGHFDLSDLLGILFFNRGGSPLDSWFLFLAFQSGGNPGEFFWGRIGAGNGSGNPGGNPGHGDGGGIAVPEPGTWLMLAMMIAMSVLVLGSRRELSFVKGHTRY